MMGVKHAHLSIAMDRIEEFCKQYNQLEAVSFVRSEDGCINRVELHYTNEAATRKIPVVAPFGMLSTGVDTPDVKYDMMRLRGFPDIQVQKWFLNYYLTPLKEETRIDLEPGQFVVGVSVNLGLNHIHGLNVILGDISVKWFDGDILITRQDAAKAEIFAE